MLNKEWLKNFGQKLQLLREKTNRTQTDLAKTIGASVTSYGMYENGTREPSLSSLRKIAAFFNVSIDKLILDESTIDNAFWTSNDFQLEILDNVKIRLTLPVSTKQPVEEDGLIFLRGIRQDIVFDDKQSFEKFTHFVFCECQSKIHEEILNLYQSIKESKNTDYLASIQEKPFERKFIPVKEI